MGDDDFGYDEGSDVDNWEAEQCFQDQCLEGEQDWDENDELDAFEDFE
jgi:hypothetical protein